MYSIAAVDVQRTQPICSSHSEKSFVTLPVSIPTAKCFYEHMRCLIIYFPQGCEDVFRFFLWHANVKEATKEADSMFLIQNSISRNEINNNSRGLRVQAMCGRIAAKPYTRSFCRIPAQIDEPKGAREVTSAIPLAVVVQVSVGTR